MGELETYWKKRDFGVTPEPKGKVKKGAPGFRYLIQKHHASHLHYDFRLELDGVLLSWAVPKGPSLDPSDKRLAMQTEDHPLDYGDFEGVIPAGEYGGGTVVMWDQGTWEPMSDPREGMKKGRLDFRLHGEKLEGGWMLVRTGGRMKHDEGGRKWLLFKKKDDVARPGYDITADKPLSVVTGRGWEEIRDAEDRVWHSNRAAKPKGRNATLKARIREAARRTTPKKVVGDRGPGPLSPSPRVEAPCPGAKKGALPSAIEPELATLVSEAPHGAEWLHEIKLDGYRIFARVEKGRVQLFTRKGKDWTATFGAVGRALAGLPVERAMFDGEVVALDAEGKSSFQLLQNAFAHDADTDRLVYYAFDLLHLDGWDLRGARLEDRKAVLAKLLEGDPAGAHVRYSDHVVGRGEAFFARACAMGVEGIVSKRRDAAYRGSRGKDWLKVKCTQRQEFVIGGYSEPRATRVALGALLLGAFDASGALRHVGKVGTGFSADLLKELRTRLEKIERDTPPFANPPRGAEARGVHWVEPTLVCEVEFTELTADLHLRHPSFRGMREDKPAREVRIEVPDEDAPPVVKKKKVFAPVGRGKHGAPIEIGGVRITNPERQLYPESGYTKKDVVEYVHAVSERMLPHIVGRPLTLVRCPEGWQGECFFQKHVTRGIPEGVRTIPIREKEGKEPYLIIDDLEGLLGIVNMGALELHVWGSREDKVEQPDQIVMDLDPDPAVPWPELAHAAREVRARLADLGLSSFVKTTGGKGLHVVAPFRRRAEWDEIKAFTKAIADAMVRDTPRKYVATVSKDKRTGRIFVDYLRNARGATAIAPWSTRRRAAAPVAVPLAWNELDAPKPPAFTIENAPERLRKKDPWSDFEKTRAAQTPPRRSPRAPLIFGAARACRM